MEYIKQNESGLYLDVQRIGCFFRAATHMAEMQAGQKLTKDQINKLWEYSKKLKYINADNNVKVSAPIANLAAKELNLKGRFIEVAIFNKGELLWYSSIPQAERRIDYYIQKISQNGPSKTHFINVDKYGQLLWDPHEPRINKTGVIYTICYKFQEEV